jgi:hypothetical protein
LSIRSSCSARCYMCDRRALTPSPSIHPFNNPSAHPPAYELTHRPTYPPSLSSPLRS